MALDDSGIDPGLEDDEEGPYNDQHMQDWRPINNGWASPDDPLEELDSGGLFTRTLPDRADPDQSELISPEALRNARAIHMSDFHRVD